MTGNKKSTLLDSDDAPDLSTSEWQAAFAKTQVRRGRPTAETPKVSTTIRLDSDVVAFFQRGGKGWQTRLNEALRVIIEKSKTKSAVRAKVRAKPRPPHAVAVAKKRA